MPYVNTTSLKDAPSKLFTFYLPYSTIPVVNFTTFKEEDGNTYLSIQTVFEAFAAEVVVVVVPLRLADKVPRTAFDHSLGKYAFFGIQ